MFFRFRTYSLLFILILCVLWHSCKDPSTIVFTTDIENVIGPFSSVSTQGPDRVAITTIDSSGWEIISNDTSYTAMSLLSTIRYDLGTGHNRIVLSKLLIQNRKQPVLSADQSHLVGYMGRELLQAFAGETPMHQQERNAPAGLADSALGYQYSAVNVNDRGPDITLLYPAGRLFNWTIQLPGNNPINIGGIPPDILTVIRPSPDSVEVLDVFTNKDYTVQWIGPNSSVDLVISDYGSGGVQPLMHVNFQHVQSNSAKIDIHTLPSGPKIFTFSTATEVTSVIDGIPIIMRFTSIHNVMVRIIGPS